MGKLLTAVAATAVVAGPAAAFYFPGWPADGLPRRPTLYAPPAGVVWPTEEVSTEVLLTRPPSAVSSPDKRPRTVPEPATLVLAAAGWAAVCVVRRGVGQRGV